MYNWKNEIKSEHGTAVDLEHCVAVYDKDNYCRGFITGSDYGQMILNQKRDEALGIVCGAGYVRLYKPKKDPLLKFTPSVGTIVDTRVEPAVKVSHKDVIKYLIDNVPQIREPIYYIDNIQKLRDRTPLPQGSVDEIVVALDSGFPNPN